MITTILQKCLDELSGDKPDLSYIRGMIEVLLASQPQSTHPKTQDEINFDVLNAGTKLNYANSKAMDEASILDAKARAALETVKALGGKTE